MRTLSASALVLALAAVTAPVFAQTSYPMLLSAHPVSAQVGQTSEHEVTAVHNLYGAYQVIVSGAGVTGEIVPSEVKAEPGKKPKVASIKVKFTVTPEAQPGVRDFRVATPQGVSTLGQLVIVRDAVIIEQPKNDTPAEAQVVTVPSTLCGTVEKAEDVDFYKFQAEAGAALSFHVQCGRLEDRIHDLQEHADLIITLRGPNGSTLAASDNYFFADPFLRHTFEQAGEYLLEVRDVRYHGNANWRYSVEVSDKPFATNLFPLGLPVGVESKVEVVGFKLPADPTAAITIPAETVEGPMAVGVPMGDAVTNPVAAFASTLPPFVEAAADNNTRELAQPVTFPAGISGRIEVENDVDLYGFDAKKGEVYSIKVMARRLLSNLDSNLRILNDQGAAIAENDDARDGYLTSSDSWLEAWTAPADGKFFIEIRDLHLRGGPEFTYFIQVTPARPHFQLTLDTDKTIVTPGTGGVIFVRVLRKNGFAGEIQLQIENLPAGVTAQCGRILADGMDGSIVLQGAADATLVASNIRVTGTAVHPQAEGMPPLELSAVATPLQEIYSPGGGRTHYPALIHTVCVAEPLDILGITLSETEISLKPGETKTIKVTLARSAEYQQNITLDVIYRHLGSIFGDSLPKGVTLDEKNSQTLLTAGQTEGSIVLIAAADAKPVERQQIAVQANVSINFVMKTTYVAVPVFVTVTAP